MGEPDVTFASLAAGGEERFVSLRRQLGVSSFGMNLIVLAPGQRGRIHRHERQEEVYLVLEGELTLALGPDDERVLGRGELARVGPATRRQLVNAGPERLLLLALGGAGEHEGRDGRAWSSWDEGGEGKPPQEVPLPDDLPAS
jgi:mannose-6-phosphate isomerase-like protein (cupin superfamily)